MVAPGTSSTPPVITRPGSPHACASTAVIMEENRIWGFYSTQGGLLHCAVAFRPRAGNSEGNGRLNELCAEFVEAGCRATRADSTNPKRFVCAMPWLIAAQTTPATGFRKM